MIKNLVSENDFNNYVNFYNNLQNKKNIFYMYFTSNLLHYVIESSKLVPDDINIVFIGSSLSNDEIQFVEKYLTRPVCFLIGKYKDGPIWEMISQCAEENYGWIDIDCFIFNPQIFYEMIKINDDVAINAIWSHNYIVEYGIDMLFANTFIEFININWIRKMREKYEYTMQLVRYPGNYGDAVMTDDQYKNIILNHPNIVKRSWEYFDTTHYFQLLACQEGYRINQIRELGLTENYYSSEAIHLSEATYIHNNMLFSGISKIYRRFNKRLSYYLLYKNLNILPIQYQYLKNIFEENLTANNIEFDITLIEQKIKSYLIRQGLDPYLFYSIYY